MNFRIRWTFFCLITCFSVFGQLNFDSLSHINYVNLHDSYLNDVWGHIDASGNEYALVGGRKGTSVVSLSNPSQAVEVHWEPGPESIWRDINTWQDYAYVTTEADTGLMILDLSSLPNASGITATYYTGPIANPWQSAHTMFIDSAGYAYIFGANRGNGGVIILDIHTNPLNPVEVGVFDNWYCHDGYVLNDTMYLAHISEGFISIVDVTDRANPVLLGTKNTTSNFSHNIWTTPDGNIGFTTDEVSGAYVGAYDLTDPSNITLLDLVQSSPGSGVLPHNVHVKDNYLITSYYSDGVVIFDASRPRNILQVGNYDTYPGQTTSYDGCWASYPFLPSGIVLAADITEGLFVLSPTYKRACYLEGFVTDQSNGSALSNVTITIENSDHTEFSRTDGSYGTGIHQEGTYNVTFFKVGFYSQTLSVDLTENTVVNLDVQLVPIPTFNLKIKVFDKNSNQPILGAHVRLKSSLTRDELQTNGLGEANFQLYYQESYELICGSWTYTTTCSDVDITDQTAVITVRLAPGIYDDFTFDYGWTPVFIGATAGLWERGKPVGTYTDSAPSVDSDSDCGDQAYVTGNSSDKDPDTDHIKGGTVILYSPIFDLSTKHDSYIHYDRWFFCYHGAQPFNDSLSIFLSNGDSTVLIDRQGSDELFLVNWMQKSFLVEDFVSPSANMQLIVKTSDIPPEVNITEAGFDHFFIDSYDHYNIDSVSLPEGLRVYPNPASESVGIANSQIGMLWKLVDLNGKLLQEQINQGNLLYFEFKNLSPGLYLLKSEEGIFKVIKN